MRSYQTREKFRILSGGEYKGRHWYGGYVMTLLHYAKTDNTELDEGVVDHILLNPYVGYRYEGAYTFDARLGYLQSLQRDRRTEEGWKAPKGGRLALSVSRWGVCLLNELYVGENMLPSGTSMAPTLCQRPLYATPRRSTTRRPSPTTAASSTTRWAFRRILFPLRRRGPGPAADPESIGQSAKTVYRPKNRRKGGKSCNFVKNIPAMAIATNDTNTKEKAANFLEEIIQESIAKGDTRVQTRFPPEPNGYLHIGHAKSICINFGLAKKYGGKCNLRFDDTNPVKEDVEYVDSIKRDIRWLGFDWALERYASDYFDQLYDWAVVLIKKGLAYVDDQTQEEIRLTRGTVSEPGKESPWRNRSVEENLDLFERMKKGEFADGEKVLRAKIDMAHPNMLFRDPIMYRILHAEHHRTGNKWCIYPMYDYAHGQCDSIERITHSICTLEFDVHRPLYDWFIKRSTSIPRTSTNSPA